MSPRKPAALRDSGGPGVREHLIATAARMLGERRGAALSVRDIARAAGVADGVLYNYFEDRDDLLAQGLLVHVGAAMHEAPGVAGPGTGTVVDNLTAFIDGGLAVLGRVLPAFAGLLARPEVLRRFHAMVGGDRAFSGADGEPGAGEPAEGQPAGGAGGQPAEGQPGGGAGGESLPAQLSAYLRAEQELGRVAPGADVEAAAALVVGAIHGLVLPPLLLGTAGTGPPSPPPGLARRLAETTVAGLAPRAG
jgi:AcrR family transcriptional regulator